MVAINISELIPSSIAEIDINEINLIKGGINSLYLSQEVFDAVPGLEAVSVFIPTEEVLERTEPFSIGEIQNIFEFTPVQPAPITVALPRRRSTRRRFSF